jgi:hypothetical protein
MNYDLLWGLPDVRAGFTFCRLMYPVEGRDPSGSGWGIEYPRADMNFLTRLSQLTTATISEWSHGVPGHTVVLATSPELFSCPFLSIASPGTAGLSDEDVAKLREYLLKGGFIWADDFWGDIPWAAWMRQVSRILPELTVSEIKPGHPLLQVFYNITEVPQIPSLQMWDPRYGTQERPGAEYSTPSMHGVFDKDGQLLILMTHNTDIADGWEREADLDSFFQAFSWRAYSMAMNVAVWVTSR